MLICTKFLPTETWKDIGRLTNFIYRPGVEDKPATFKPQSVRYYLHGFFERVWDCEAVVENSGDEIAVKQVRFFHLSRIDCMGLTGLPASDSDQGDENR